MYKCMYLFFKPSCLMLHGSINYKYQRIVNFQITIFPNEEFRRVRYDP